MTRVSRRQVLRMAVAASAGAACVDGALAAPDQRPAAVNAAAGKVDVHEQILALAAQQQDRRRARFAAVASKADLEALQQSLRGKFIRLLGGLPGESGGAVPVQRTGRIEADDYVIDKIVYQSMPGYYVSAVLYKPRRVDGALPGVISPCGHSAVGKAADSYQALHINLAKRGYVVLSYDPVGQGERSQFWDAGRGASRFNLVCGEHAVLGNPMYLLGGSLARYRIWDGMRGLDLLASLPQVDATKLACVGNSGGGTLSAYIAALDSRVAVAAICCYITALPRRMGNRIEADPDADPEQDIFGFVGDGIDHAGLLALRAPRPTLLGTAKFDFFPIEGAVESFDEARRLFAAAGAADRVARVEAPARHGLSLPLRQAVYGWFDRWLLGRKDAAAVEAPVKPRPASELQVCKDGQVNVTFKSRPLLPLAFEQFNARAKPARKPLRQVLALDFDQAAPAVTLINAPGAALGGAPGAAQGAAAPGALVVLVNGNQTPDWRQAERLLEALRRRGDVVAVVDPRGAGTQRSPHAVRGKDYADALAGVEENIAYNAFLVGKSLVGMRVTDVLAAVKRLKAKHPRRRLVVCGRRDAALVAVLAAAVEPAITHVAAQELLMSHAPLFAAEGYVINAASILPALLRDFGDVADVLAELPPRKALLAAGIGAGPKPSDDVRIVAGKFTDEPGMLTQWVSS